MKTVALISGGKDSCFNMMQCIMEGHEIVALANLQPEGKDELDSYMYQTVGHHAVELYAEAMDLPLYRHTIKGTSKHTGSIYTPTQDDEVEDLFVLLQKVKSEVDIEAVSVGAILSNYQRVRVENVCQRLGLTSLAYLWRRDQSELLTEMVNCGVSAILVKVASWGLDPNKHLQKTIASMLPELLKMKTTHQLNVCGEGGEYETFTLDCPLFKKKIVLDEVEQVIHSSDPYSPVGYLNLKSAHLEDKHLDPCLSHKEMVEKLHMRRSCDIRTELEAMEQSLVDLQNTTINTTETGSQSCGNCNRLSGDHIVMSERGDNFHVSGVMAYYTEDEDFTTAIVTAMNKLKARLTDAGWDMSHLVLICLYVKKMEDFGRINNVYKTYFGVNPPARVCVQTCLPDNVVMQIDCYGNRSIEKSTMHVQSISHWASANIGPYSQAVQVNNRIYVAGQIALVPGSMKIVDGGIIPEACLALRHADRILAAKHTGCNLENVVSAVCYVTSPDYMDKSLVKWAKAQLSKAEDDSGLTVVFVLVPQLPRNAKIEWQFTADIHSDTLKDFTHSCSDHGYTTVIRSWVSCNEEATSFYCTGFTERAESCPEQLVLRNVVESFCMCHKKTTESYSSRSSAVLRIFYKSAIFDYKELHKCLTELLCDRETFVLVPVIELQNPMFLLSVSQ